MPISIEFRVQRQQIDQGAMNRLLRAPQSGVVRDMLRRGRNVETAAKGFVGVDTGRLRASSNTNPVTRGDATGAQVGSDLNYSLVHHEGHGVIRPRRGQFLVFVPKGQTQPVFAKSVRAVEGTKYLTRALPRARG